MYNHLQYQNLPATKRNMLSTQEFYLDILEEMKKRLLTKDPKYREHYGIRSNPQQLYYLIQGAKYHLNNQSSYPKIAIDQRGDPGLGSIIQAFQTKQPQIKEVLNPILEERPFEQQVLSANQENQCIDVPYVQDPPEEQDQLYDSDDDFDIINGQRRKRQNPYYEYIPRPKRKRLVINQDLTNSQSQNDKEAQIKEAEKVVEKEVEKEVEVKPTKKQKKKKNSKQANEQQIAQILLNLDNIKIFQDPQLKKQFLKRLYKQGKIDINTYCEIEGPLSCSSQQQQSSEEQMQAEFQQKLNSQINCLIVGLYTNKNLRRKSKNTTDKLNVRMHDVIVKLGPSGRDIFFDTLIIDLGRIDKRQIFSQNPGHVKMDEDLVKRQYTNGREEDQMKEEENLQKKQA